MNKMSFIKILKNPKPYVLAGTKKVKNNFRKYFYKGDIVICEICTWKGKRFFNRKCPNCNSVPRTRLVPYSIKYFNLVKDNLKILHIAPNMNEYYYVKENFNNLLCYDRLDKKQRKHTNIKGSITNTNIDSNTYDLVIVWHVFEHIKEDIKAILEINRVLKQKGNLLVCVPIYPEGNLLTFEDSSIQTKDYDNIHGHYDHCRSCGLDYYKRFEAIGFNTKTLFVNSLDQDKIDYFGLKTDHVVWCFTK